MYLCKIIHIKRGFKISDLSNALLGSSFNKKIYILIYWFLEYDRVEQIYNKVTWRDLTGCLVCNACKELFHMYINSSTILNCLVVC